jgi:hypothetical protein
MVRILLSAIVRVAWPAGLPRILFSLRVQPRRCHAWSRFSHPLRTCACGGLPRQQRARLAIQRLERANRVMSYALFLAPTRYRVVPELLRDNPERMIYLRLDRCVAPRHRVR